MAEGIKGLVGQRMTKTVKFMNKDITIQKLTVAEVLAIQEKAKNADKDETEGFNVLKTVIRSAVPGADELSDEDFNSFPLEDLTKLSNEVMKYSGISADQGK
jgi:hypothetical protein